MNNYQDRVNDFMMACFGPGIAGDTKERNHRFVEESLELVQSLGCTAAEAHMLVDYVFGRPIGEPDQETGGVMVTLAALCTAAGLDMSRAGNRELQRVWGKIDVIREKQKGKPRGSPLPQATRPEELIPEGCTPTDARVLREANAVFAEENQNLRRCLRWYANGEHYTGLIHWEGPSGDDNWLCPPGASEMPHYEAQRQEFIAKLDEAMVEDGSVARATLVSGKFEVESPEDEPALIRGEPEWKIEQEAQALVSPQRLVEEK